MKVCPHALQKYGLTMGDFNSILYEMNSDEFMWFLSSCVAKMRNLHSVPRIFNTDDLVLIFSRGNFFDELDDKYFDLIDDEMTSKALTYLSENKINFVFDLCRYDFSQKDELYESVNADSKKLFNLKMRYNDKEKFCNSNQKYFSSPDYVFDFVVKSKLNNIWIERWGDISAYVI